MARRRKKLLWAPFGVGTQALAASAAVSVDLMSLIRSAVPSVNNFNVVRIRGVFGIRPTAANNNSLFYDAGIVVVTQPAFDAGATPDPEADDVSWLWFGTPIWTPSFVKETAAGVFVSASSLWDLDTKAIRKVPQADSTISFAVKNRQAVTSEFNLEGRMLLDLK